MGAGSQLRRQEKESEGPRLGRHEEESESEGGGGGG